MKVNIVKMALSHKKAVLIFNTIYELTWTGKVKTHRIKESKTFNNHKTVMVLLDNIGVLLFGNIKGQKFCRQSNSLFFTSITDLDLYFKQKRLYRTKLELEDDIDKYQKKVEYYSEIVKQKIEQLNTLTESNMELSESMKDALTLEKLFVKKYHIDKNS